jgi:hypothetical protein
MEKKKEIMRNDLSNRKSIGEQHGSKPAGSHFFW